MMTEKLLQFIWKHRYFSQHNLELTTGEKLSIEYPGEENHHQGPDFLNARIRIPGRLWIGHVEIHLFSSGWEKHNHSGDENYRNVVLHVVWKNDRTEMTRNMPELELCHRIPILMLETYSAWMRKPSFVPCERSVGSLPSETWKSWHSQLNIIRLERRMGEILKSMQQHKYHWEEQLWWQIAIYFGGPVNASAFGSVAKSIPYSLLARHRLLSFQLEALFMGQANMLNRDFTDPYPASLKEEYRYLKRKYGLKEIYEPIHFLRMRPENFPTIRFSQLAALFSNSTSLFSWVLSCDSICSLQKRLRSAASGYWDNHYLFEKPSSIHTKVPGKDVCNRIIINGIIPILYTYGRMLQDPLCLNKAFQWLNELPPEKNKITEQWKKIGANIRSASSSQSLNELKKYYCDQRRCLECELGKKILASEIT